MSVSADRRNEGLPLSRVEDTHSLLEVLRKQLNTETDRDVKAIILQLLADVARQPHVDASLVLTDILGQVQRL